MYHDEIFENALRDVKEENYKALKNEISSMEASIERFFRKRQLSTDLLMALWKAPSFPSGSP